MIALIMILSIGVVLFNEYMLIYNRATDLWAFIFLFFAVVIICLIRNLVRKGADPYEVINPMLLGYTLYSMMLPLNFLVTLHVPTFEITIPGVAQLPMYQYLMICNIGLAGLLIGYYLPFGRQYGIKFPVLKVTTRELRITAALLMVYGLFSFATNVAAYGSLTNYIKVGYGPQRFVIQRQALQFGAGIEIIGIASLILMYIYLKERKKIKSLLIISVLIAIAYLVLLIGERRHIIYLLFIGFVIINYQFFRIKLRWMMVTVLLAYLFFFIYPHTRKLWAEIGFVKGITETYKVAVEKPELMLPFAGGEFIPPSKVILEMLTDNSFQFQYGASYLIGIINIIPRVAKAMPEVLQSLSDWRRTRYYPGLYERGVNFTFFTVAEGYLNFGYLGVLLHMFILGLLTKMLYAYFFRNRDNPFVVVVYATIFALMPIESIHAESGQFLWHVTHTYVGPLLLICMAVKFFDSVCMHRS